MGAMQRLAWRFRAIPPLLVFANSGIVTPSACDGSTPESGLLASTPAPKAGGSGWTSTSPRVVKAGDPVLLRPAIEVDPTEVTSERMQNIIDDMIRAMRYAHGVGLAAPHIGIPYRIIVLEDKKEYMGYNTRGEIKPHFEAQMKAQDRKPFDLLVILNPKLEKKSNKTALFFEGCLSVPGFGAMVERHLEVEVTGFNRFGEPIKIKASGWQARILQHVCDHLDGTMFVDKMVPKTFRSTTNWKMPLPPGCNKPGPR